MFLFDLFKNKNIKKYGHVISLGYNCEVSLRFFNQYKFVESSLFAWVNTINIDNLIFALKNPDLLIEGELEPVKPMWKCKNTNINFHGKAPVSVWYQEKIDEDIIKKDKEELISRVKHLKEKFLKTATDGKKNLYIFKYLIKDETQDTVKMAIVELFETLKEINSNEFDLLIVLENKENFKNLEYLLQNKNIYVRFVEYFSPEVDVTGKNFDKKGWKKIFSEFRPAFKLKKTTTFKFEEH